MKTSVIVLSYNWPAALELILERLALQSHLPDEIIIADDGSTQATTDLVNKQRGKSHVPLRHVWQEDKGFRAARCRNRGIAAAQGDYIILLDGDMLLHREFIADHLRLAAPNSFLRGGRIKATEDESARLLHGKTPVFAPWSNARFGDFDCTRRHYAFHAPRLAQMKAKRGGSGMVMSCNMSFWREDLLRVNGFDERMEGYGAEDRELAVRLENAGISPRPLKWAALAVHLNHESRAQTNVDDPALPNNRLLQQTIDNETTRCQKGIDTHTDLLPK